MVRKGYSYRQLVEDINGQGGIQVVRGGKLEKGYSQLKSETDKDEYSQLKKDTDGQRVIQIVKKGKIQLYEQAEFKGNC